MNSSSPRWATDALRNHLVRFGRRSVEEARSNRRASNLRQSRPTAREDTSVCPEACQLALLPASGRRLSRHPGHPGNRSPDPSAKGGASKIDLLTSGHRRGVRFKSHPVHTNNGSKLLSPGSSLLPPCPERAKASGEGSLKIRTSRGGTTTSLAVLARPRTTTSESSVGSSRRTTRLLKPS